MSLVTPTKLLLGSVKVGKLPIDLLDRISIGVIAGVPGSSPKGQSGEDLIIRGRLSLAYQATDGILWRSHNALPRAFLSSNLEMVDWGEQALGKLVKADYSPRDRVAVHPVNDADKALLAGFKPGPSLDHGHVTFNLDWPNRIHLAVQSSQSAILVLNDTWAPGWTATVNGEAAQVLRANYAYRAVFVPAGTSRVVFTYHPWPLIVGLVLTFTSLILMVIYMLVRAWTFMRRRTVTAIPNA